MRPHSTALLCLLSGALAGALGAGSRSLLASASELDTDARVFPYSGTIELNGASYAGTVSLKIDLTDDGSCTYSETQNVAVSSGRFTVNIGSTSTTGVPACIFNAQKVYVVLSVKGSGDSSYTALSGRQRVRPVPFALWSAEGSDYVVTGTVSSTGSISTTGGGITASGAFTGASLSTSGAGTVGGALTAGNKTTGNTLEFKGYDFKFGTDDGRTTASSTRYAMSHSAADKLAINSGSGNTGGIEINGASTLLGGVTMGDGNKPATGKPQLILANNVDGTLDNINDYQLQFWSGSSANNTYGWGTLTSSMFANTAQYYRFYVNGTEKLQINGGSANTTLLSTDFTVSGSATSTGVTGTTLTLSGNATAAANTWDDCGWEGFTHGTTNNGEELSAECSNGRIIVGYKRYHGSFDYGIEDFSIKCCRL